MRDRGTTRDQHREKKQRHEQWPDCNEQPSKDVHTTVRISGGRLAIDSRMTLQQSIDELAINAVNTVQVRVRRRRSGTCMDKSDRRYDRILRTLLLLVSSAKSRQLNV